MADLPKLDAARRDWAERIVDVVWRTGEATLGEAQRLAPVDEGTLRGSGTIAVYVNGTPYTDRGSAMAAAAASRGRLDVYAELRFDLPYAAKQHEDMALRHPKGGQAKYLEQPVGRAADRLTRLLALTTRASLG